MGNTCCGHSGNMTKGGEGGSGLKEAFQQFGADLRIGKQDAVVAING